MRQATETRPKRGSWFQRLREWWMVVSEPTSYDWTEPETAPATMQARPAEHGPAHVQTGVPEGHTVGPMVPATVHPPFAHEPAFHTHVAIRMQRILVEASWDPQLTPRKLWSSLAPIIDELSGLVAAEDDQARRMERNQATAAAQAAVLEDAVLRGEGEVASAQAVAAMKGRAVHVGAETPTGVLPRITKEMADPRGAEQDPVPLPSAPFVGGESAIAVGDLIRPRKAVSIVPPTENELPIDTLRVFAVHGEGALVTVDAEDPAGSGAFWTLSFDEIESVIAPSANEPTVPIEPDHPWTPDDEAETARAEELQEQYADSLDNEQRAEIDARKSVAA